ncbi:ClpP/crotonase-like domain-containing protein [Aspergillus desertorum]
MPSDHTHITLDITDQIGIVKLNRPEHERTVFTVLTGEGRFFSAGADIRQNIPRAPETASARMLFRSMIDDTKILVLALNGPGVGGGAAWFTGLADVVLAASGAYLQVPFNSLGLVPEFGAARTFTQSIGVRRANDLLMFGRKCTVEELEGWGLINRVFPAEEFKDQVVTFLQGQLEVNDGRSMLETKRLMNSPLRGERMLAMFDAANALAERFVAGAPFERFVRRNEELEIASKARRGKGKAFL